MSKQYTTKGGILDLTDDTFEPNEHTKSILRRPLETGIALIFFGVLLYLVAPSFSGLLPTPPLAEKTSTPTPAATPKEDTSRQSRAEVGLLWPIEFPIPPASVSDRKCFTYEDSPLFLMATDYSCLLGLSISSQREVLWYAKTVAGQEHAIALATGKGSLPLALLSPREYVDANNSSWRVSYGYEAGLLLEDTQRRRSETRLPAVSISSYENLDGPPARAWATLTRANAGGWQAILLPVSFPLHNEGRPVEADLVRELLAFAAASAQLTTAIPAAPARCVENACLEP